MSLQKELCLKFSILSLAIVFPLSFAAYGSSSSPIGSYSNGSIRNAVNLPEEGNGYMRLFVDRNRGWGSEELVSMIVEASSEMNQLFPDKDRLQVGDLGAQTGGQITRHGSHQNGLDVDLTYYRNNGQEQSPNQTNGFSEVMVINGKLSANFDITRNWELMKTLHKYGNVQRIFVDPVIKTELCKHAKAIGDDRDHAEVLRSLRPYQKHADHLHVRLYCPIGAKECIPQAEVPAGTGC
jgi:penicillin-insensitive murein endopeptidase